MRAMLLDGPRRPLRLADLPEPEPGPGQIGGTRCPSGLRGTERAGQRPVEVDDVGRAVPDQQDGGDGVLQRRVRQVVMRGAAGE